MSHHARSKNFGGIIFEYPSTIFILRNTKGGHMDLGKRNWAIAEGYIPATSTAQTPEMESHETVCILNASVTKANVTIMVYFTDRDPYGPYKFTVEPRRTIHLKFNDFKLPQEVPKGVPYASTIESDMPIVVQHTRLDSRQSANALMTTIAYSQ
jgi:hypothetical protein